MGIMVGAVIVRNLEKVGMNAKQILVVGLCLQSIYYIQCNAFLTETTFPEFQLWLGLFLCFSPAMVIVNSTRAVISNIVATDEYKSVFIAIATSTMCIGRILGSFMAGIFLANDEIEHAFYVPMTVTYICGVALLAYQWKVIPETQADKYVTKEVPLMKTPKSESLV